MLLIGQLQDFVNVFKDTPFKFHLLMSILFVNNFKFKDKDQARQLEGIATHFAELSGDSKDYFEMFLQDYKQRKKKRKNILKKIVKI